MTRNARNAGIIHTVPFKSIVERVKKTDMVNATISPMDNIPAGANPFHHDSHSMGTELSRGWMVMHSGNFDDHGHEHMYLVNTVTGQRIGLDFEAVEDRFTESVYAGLPNLDTGELYVWTRNYRTAEFYSLIDHLRIKWSGMYGLVRGHKSSPVYVYVGPHFVRVDVVTDAEAFARWCDVNEISVDDTHPAVIAANRYKTAQLMLAAHNDDVTQVVIDYAAVEKRICLGQNADFEDTTVLESKHGDKGVTVKVLPDGE